MKQLRLNSGRLDAWVLEPDEGGARADVNIILCHGFGAPGEDLVGLGPELVALAPALASRVRWIFPQAPLSLADMGLPSGRAWWLIDMERLIVERDWASYIEAVPEGLPKARRMLMALIDDLSAKTQVPIGRTIVGGFSQGAMLTTDVALRLEEAPLGLVALSGALISRGAWVERAPKRAGLPVFQSHGRRDPILPYEVGEKLRGVLEEGGLSVTFVPHDGEHAIPMRVLHELASWLTARLPGRPETGDQGQD